MLQIKDTKVGKCWFSILSFKVDKTFFSDGGKEDVKSLFFYLPDYDQSHNMHTDIIMINLIYMHRFFSYVCVTVCCNHLIQNL